jgi:uncharacterized damage-inducible protein DinB
MAELSNYKYRGARALILLHESHMKIWFETWKKAKELGVSLPITEDPNYQSLDTLLYHTLRAARGYMQWMCEKLELPDPKIENPPALEEIEKTANDYLEHLLKQWRLPLQDIEEERFYNPSYKSRWGVDYCIDAMLEHAVMHPIRHYFQLQELIENKK